MNPDLRAIEAVLLGEACDPSNLSPEVASVVLPLVRRVVRERDELREALEEARMTLAAEQGRAEGAPSAEWEYNGARWTKRSGQNSLRTQRVAVGWEWWIRNEYGTCIIDGVVDTARAAMLAADKALFESRRTRCLAKVRQLQTDGVILYPPNGTHQQTPAIMINRLSDPDLTEAVLSVYEKVLFP